MPAGAGPGWAQAPAVAVITAVAVSLLSGAALNPSIWSMTPAEAQATSETINKIIIVSVMTDKLLEAAAEAGLQLDPEIVDEARYVASLHESGLDGLSQEEAEQLLSYSNNVYNRLVQAYIAALEGAGVSNQIEENVIREVASILNMTAQVLGDPRLAEASIVLLQSLEEGNASITILYIVEDEVDDVYVEYFGEEIPEVVASIIESLKDTGNVTLAYTILLDVLDEIEDVREILAVTANSTEGEDEFEVVMANIVAAEEAVDNAATLLELLHDEGVEDGNATEHAVTAALNASLADLREDLVDLEEEVSRLLSKATSVGATEAQRLLEYASGNLTEAWQYYNMSVAALEQGNFSLALNYYAESLARAKIAEHLVYAAEEVLDEYIDYQEAMSDMVEEAYNIMEDIAEVRAEAQEALAQAEATNNTAAATLAQEALSILDEAETITMQVIEGLTNGSLTLAQAEAMLEQAEDLIDVADEYVTLAWSAIEVAEELEEAYEEEDELDEDTGEDNTTSDEVEPELAGEIEDAHYYALDLLEQLEELENETAEAADEEIQESLSQARSMIEEALNLLDQALEELEQGNLDTAQQLLDQALTLLEDAEEIIDNAWENLEDTGQDEDEQLA